eukprot:PITA_25851
MFDRQARSTGHSPDCRERALLNYVLENAEKGNAESVLKAIDSFTRHTWLPILGREKGSNLDAVVHKYNPNVALELGTYCGYSSIIIASRMAKPDSKLISVEMNAHNYEIATKMIEHAGLSSKVTVLKGTLSEVYEELEEFLITMETTNFDFIFMDHFRERYLPDILLLIDKGMVRKGTVIVADSIGFSEARNYLKYLKEHPEELDSEESKSDVEWMSWFPCTMTVSTYIADDVNIVT